MAGRPTAPVVLDARAPSLLRQLELFGSGPWERAYAFGPYRALVGQPAVANGANSSLRYERVPGPRGPRLRAALRGSFEGEDERRQLPEGCV